MNLSFTSPTHGEQPNGLEKKTPSFKSHYLGSSILLGVGLLGLIPGGILYSMDGNPTGDLCPVGEAMYPCHWNTKAAYASTFATAGVGISSGLIWLLVTAAGEHKARGTH